MNGQIMTLRQVKEQGINPREVQMFYYIQYLDKWERVNWISGDWDVNTGKGWATRSWAGTPDREVTIR